MKNACVEKTFVRTSVQDIGSLVEYLYENVLLFCESSEIDNLKGCRIDVKEFAKPIEKRVRIEYNEITKVDITNKSSKNILINTINVKTLDNVVYFVPNGNKIISLIKHIRNAFAHNLIVLDGDYVIIGDFLSNNNGVPYWKFSTMLGRLSIDNLKLLISTIKDMKLK